ncbi:MAG: VCBS repeat-containing protein [Candidatus Hydrogenedentes bacterium]|nr:VCBS repeat-containing protein [Candidatus Hydrogenedentota bacterium]
MLTTTLLAVAFCAAAESPVLFERTPIGNTTYEAASVFDVDKDGHLDLVSGGYWHAGPDYKTAHKICDVMPVDDYYDDFSDYPMDVNGDGYLDIITGAWFGSTVYWRENPKGKSVEWETHAIANTGNIERCSFYDIDGDGYVEVFATTSPVHFFRLVRDKQGTPQGRFEQFTITNGGGGHGFGCGDLNGDGRPDLIFSGGWMEAPENPYDTDAWKWHPEFDFGMASVPILVYDVNEDGKNDLIVGGAHGYGLWWYEQQGGGQWKQHVVETHRSQFHEMQLSDIDNDGKLEVVTGKRYRAHRGHDAGSADPLGTYYYDIDPAGFTRHTVDYGPFGQASGIGIYGWITDVDADGWKDILAPGKEGLFLFRSLGR